MNGSARVLRGDALALPLPAASVDLVVTSPPYFGLRSYTDAGQHYAGQVGSETTPGEYVDALIAATAEMVRILKPAGSIWVNLGDKYAERGGPARIARADGGQVVHRAERPRRKGEAETGIRQKSLMGLPWRYALHCIDDLGLTLRAEVIWSKPNGLPESVTDRVRRSHEQWFHFTLQPRYYSALDELREPPTDDRHTVTRHQRTDRRAVAESRYGAPSGIHRELPAQPGAFNPAGKLPGSVWSIPTQPLNAPVELGIDHYAAFPVEWPLRLIRGWSPPGTCATCGHALHPRVVTRQEVYRKAGSTGRPKQQDLTGTHGNGRNGVGYPQTRSVAEITGYDCACQDATGPSMPSVVLDPFGGTGTTALAAKVLGRHGISLDMSSDYCRLAEWRTNDPGQMAAARDRIRRAGGTTALTDTDDLGLFGLEAIA